ncbi:MAG: response regulator [Candidatus Omnitrophica bacterium]|jgi:CheY-like chemotaxis protein|nr:response regulator [Candidatus Omnitrophota bacterium]
MVKKILIIDDEIYFAKLVKMNLELGGDFKVEIAVKGYEGIKLAARLKPHLILLDLLMPDMNGLQVMEELKKDPKTAHIPLAMLSAKGDDATRKEVLRKDVDLFIAKPISAEDLKDKIIKILKGATDAKKENISHR